MLHVIYCTVSVPPHSTVKTKKNKEKRKTALHFLNFLLHSKIKNKVLKEKSKNCIIFSTLSIALYKKKQENKVLQEKTKKEKLLHFLNF